MSTVELSREIDGLDLVGALAARGLKGQLVSAREYVAVQVDGCDETQLAHVIEDWLFERNLPLVPLRIDDCTFAVSPPAG